MAHVIIIGKVIFGIESRVSQLLELISYEAVFLREPKPLSWKVSACFPRMETEALHQDNLFRPSGPWVFVFGQ